MMPQRRPSKYQPLVAWLQALPAEQASASLSMAAIEQLLGAPLPESAYGTSHWAGHLAYRHWRRIGFVARFSHRDGGTVTFMRGLEAPHKYAALIAWLQALPAEQQEVRLTFAEITALIGAPLPVTARVEPGVWTNPRAAVYRVPPGFRAHLDKHGGSVTFIRVQA